MSYSKSSGVQRQRSVGLRSRLRNKGRNNDIRKDDAGCRVEGAKGQVDEVPEQEPDSPEEKSETGKTEETGVLGGDLGWVEFVLLTAILKGLLGLCPPRRYHQVPGEHCTCPSRPPLQLTRPCVTSQVLKVRDQGRDPADSPCQLPLLVFFHYEYLYLIFLPDLKSDFSASGTV